MKRLVIGDDRGKGTATEMAMDHGMGNILSTINSDEWSGFRRMVKE